MKKSKSERSRASSDLQKKNHNYVVPGMVSAVQMTVKVGAPVGQRVLEFAWTPPDMDEFTQLPLKKYIVQVFDPKFGRFLNIATLEPDYYEDRGRFLGIEELNFFTLKEAEMGKL